MAIDFDRVIVTVDDNVADLSAGQSILLASGVPGHSATIAIGTVTTLPAGSPATVENVGNETDAVFDFGIPKGADGDNAPAWGNITGTLSDQEDLKAALDDKADADDVTAALALKADAADLGGMAYEDDAEEDDAQYIRSNGAWEDLAPTLAKKADVIESAASGAIVTVTDGAAAPVVDLTVAIEPVQDLNGYDYPWPEGGRLAAPSEERAYYTLGTTLFADDGGRITKIENGYSYSDSANTGITLLIGYFAAGTVFSFSADTNVNLFRLLFSTTKVTDTDTVCTNKASVNNNNGHWTFTAEESGYYYAAFYQSDRSNQPWTVENFLVGEGPYANICPISGWTGVNVFRYAQYDASAVPTLSISFPTEAGTVYGGSLDVTSGVLTVDRYGVDLGTLSWAKHPSIANAFKVALSPASVNGYLLRSICSKYKLYNSSTVGQQTYGIAISNPGTGIYIKDIDYSDVTTLTQSLDGETLVYTLAIPLTYQLTPQEVSTLLGMNNIWADTGDVSVTYRADTKLYIDGAIEAVTPDTVEVTGTTPGITAVAGTRYICGECATLGITLPESGIVDVIFSSGSTPTVLTVTPPSGVTLKWANGFDPTDLDADTVYEINIMDGLGVAVSWT